MKIDQIMTSFVCYSIITFPFIGIKGVFLSFIYTAFLFMPFSLLISRIDTGFLEKFMLSNITGLSYLAIPAILDVVFKVKLTLILFLVLPISITIMSYYFIRNRK